MTVLYFESFDMHIQKNSDEGFALVEDLGAYWSGGTMNFMSYVDGYLYGQALRVVNFIGYDNNLPTDTFRIGWWGRVNNERDPSGHAGTDLFSIANLTDSVHVAIDKDNNKMSLMINNDTVWAEFSTISATDFNHYEVYWNNTTHTCEFRENGILVAHTSSCPTISSPTFTFGKNQVSLARHYVVVDHVYVTDGDTVVPGINGVSVNCTSDDFKTDGYLKGHIDFGADPTTEWHQHPTKQHVSIGSDSFNTGSNIAQVLTWVWTENPRSNLAWTTTAFNLITSFGVCLSENNAGLDYRIACLTLNYLDYNNGKPVIVTKTVGGDTAFSTGSTWVKSNTAKTYAALVRAVPRIDTQNLSEADYLTTSTIGCIAFSVGPSLGDTDAEQPAGILGITFAEEFRTDNLDWVRVFGTGGGQQYNSFFKAGYMLPGAGDHQFSGNYVTINYENLTGGQAYIQGLWDYAVDADTGRWSMRQKIYADPYANESFKHAPRKIKIRGKGRALQLYVTSKDNAPFKINGWSLVVLIKQSV